MLYYNPGGSEGERTLIKIFRKQCKRGCYTIKVEAIQNSRIFGKWELCDSHAGYDDPIWMVSPMFMGGISITASNLTAGRTETEIVGCMCV